MLAYMTGILPIKKYGTHSALYIFDEYSMTNPGIFSDFAGFTENEVKGLCEKYHKDFEEVRRWYDGYQLRNHLHIYNPKSIVDSMYEKNYKSYWTNTETYEALKVYIDMNFVDKDDVLTLLVHLGYLAYHEDS